MFVFSCLSACAQADIKSLWDQQLPSIDIPSISIKAGSLTEAWQTIGTEYLFRSILVLAPEIDTSTPFVYQSTDTTSVGNIFSALATAYPHYVVTQDEEYGVTWIHPDSLPYSLILPNIIDVTSEQKSLSMVTGLLWPLSGVGAGHFKIDLMSGNSIYTFNYSVDVPIGQHSIREFLNICCMENCSKSFLITYRRGMEYPPVIFPIPLSPTSGIPYGAPRYWKTYLDEPITKEDLTHALSSEESVTRWVARNYYEACCHMEIAGYPTAYIGTAAATPENLRLALSLGSYFYRWPGRGCPARPFLENCLSSGFFGKDRGVLGLEGAIELARINGNTEPLEEILRSLSPPTIDPDEESEIWRLLRKLVEWGQPELASRAMAWWQHSDPYHLETVTTTIKGYDQSGQSLSKSERPWPFPVETHYGFQ
jgi:hypothetical protein